MNKIMNLMISTIFVTYTASVSAIPIATVGGVDTMVNYTLLGNSGDAAELQFFADYLQVDASTLTLDKVVLSDGNNWLEVNGDAANQDLWAFDFAGLDPDLYVIKTGENTALAADPTITLYDTFLYTNEISLDYAVIDLNDFVKVTANGTKVSTIDIYRVSHVSVTNAVPEPGLMGLLAIGLIGMVVTRRRVKV